MVMAVLAVVVGGTGAFFTSQTTSTGNVFTAGNIDLKVNHTAASYNGEHCTERCVPVGPNLILNGGFETPALSNGSFAIYPDASQTNWTVESGAGLEIQRNVAGAPYEGQQHAELDSHNPSSISQTITTVPGQRYEFSFWHSPRPNVPVGDNTIGYEVLVVSDNTTLLTGSVGASSVGGSNTSWTKYTYQFVAAGPSTKILFRDLGNNPNTLGGYIDDVVVRLLECTYGGYTTPGGKCELWTPTNLTTQKFFNFSDVKPQDRGTNLISMVVEDNQAYICLNVADKENKENTHTAPEIAAGDTTSGPPQGELGQHLMVVGWRSDNLGNKTGLPLFVPTNVNDLNTITFADSTTSPVNPGVVQYIHLEWCFGQMTLSGNNVTCNGNVPNINQTQTDAFLADLQFFAVQSRNNNQFRCSEAFDI